VSAFVRGTLCYNGEMAREIFFYLDDSGVLHKNAEERYFVYAGYVFPSKKEKDRALAKYRWAVRQLKRVRHSRLDKEIKAYRAKPKTKRFLVSQLSEFESLSCIVDKSRVYGSILDAKKSIHRYKDYCIKRAARAKLEDLVTRGIIDPDEDITIRFFIDNQPTSTDGVYNLRESIKEELKNGIANFDYGVFHSPIFRGKLGICTTFCDSKNHYLIQASDFLANNIFTRRNYDSEILHKQKHHTEILLP